MGQATSPGPRVTQPSLSIWPGSRGGSGQNESPGLLPTPTAGPSPKGQASAKVTVCPSHGLLDSKPY